MFAMEGFARFRGRRGQGTSQVSAVTRIQTRLPPSCRGSGAANFFFACQLELFFTADICVGSPSCPQIESQIPPSPPPPARSLPSSPAALRAVNPQTNKAEARGIPRKASRRAANYIPATSLPLPRLPPTVHAWGICCR